MICAKTQPQPGLLPDKVEQSYGKECLPAGLWPVLTLINIQKKAKSLLFSF
jgi:hypothetical protein